MLNASLDPLTSQQAAEGSQRLALFNFTMPLYDPTKPCTLYNSSFCYKFPDKNTSWLLRKTFSLFPICTARSLPSFPSTLQTHTFQPGLFLAALMEGRSEFSSECTQHPSSAISCALFPEKAAHASAREAAVQCGRTCTPLEKQQRGLWPANGGCAVVFDAAFPQFTSIDDTDTRARKKRRRTRETAGVVIKITSETRAVT